MSTLALFIPIASLVTVVTTGGRIGQAQTSGGLGDKVSGGLGLLLAFLLATHLVYYQSGLNKIWAQHGSPPEGTAV